MAFARFVLWACLSAALFGCGGIGSDLAPSGEDLRPVALPGTIGPGVGQRAPAFSLYDTLGNRVDLEAALQGRDGAVLYFTMWCPVCDTHMSHIQSDVASNFPGVGFYAVDYVSGSVAAARDAQISSGYMNSIFTVLADETSAVAESYDATMGTSVVISREGIILSNEDYKDGSRLVTALNGL